MDYAHLMRTQKAYANHYADMPNDKQTVAKDLCWEFNRTLPSDTAKRHAIITQLFGDSTDLTFVEDNFHCDYGFNIHSEGMALLNYNCTILDTSPVTLGNGVFIAPNVTLACSGHAVNPAQRADGIGTSAPITLKDNVWIGAGTVVLAGVTIGEGSVIGAGSVVNRDISANVVAAGSPAKVIRKITEADRIAFER